MGDAADDMMFRELGSANKLFDMQKNKQVSKSYISNSGITAHQIHEWVESLKTKNKGFSTNINNRVLFEAMKALLLIETLNRGDLENFLFTELEKTSNDERPWADMLDEISSLILKNIQENMNYGL